MCSIHTLFSSTTILTYSNEKLKTIFGRWKKSEKRFKIHLLCSFGSHRKELWTTTILKCWPNSIISSRVGYEHKIYERSFVCLSEVVKVWFSFERNAIVHEHLFVQKSTTLIFWTVFNIVHSQLCFTPTLRICEKQKQNISKMS